MKPGLRQTLIWISIGLNVAFAAGVTAVALFPSALADPLGLQPDKSKRPEKRERNGGGADWFLTGTIKRLDAQLNLSPEQKAAIEERSDLIRSGSRDAWKEMHEQRTRMMQAIIMNPEDSAKIEAVKVENRAMWDMFSDELIEGLRDIVIVLTPEQRATLAEELSKPPEPHSRSKD